MAPHRTSSSRPHAWRWLAVMLAGGALQACGHDKPRVLRSAEPALTRPRLEARAVLPAATWAPGPSSGARVGTGVVNGIPVPFVDRQPVQGFSGVLDNGDGTFLAMADNGYGVLENSADFILRVYTVRPDFKTREGGRGSMSVEGWFELRDPDKHVPFAITNHFTAERILTGADFDIESFQRVADGSFWFGDEFGPFLLHTDATGKLLEAPIPLPDFDNGGELRTPQNPFAEEASAVRVMNALRAHARARGAFKTPVFSPNFLMLNDKDPRTGTADRLAPPAGSGLSPAATDIFDVKSLQSAGYPVVTWTVNDLATMKALLALGVNGIISDRPDLLLQAAREFVVPGQTQPGGLLDADGLIDITRFDAQGHRGSRDLRPENTLPAYEAALDNLVTTLEMDAGISADGVPMMAHEPFIEGQKCRRVDGQRYDTSNPVLLKSLTAARIQSTFICDRVTRPGTPQSNHLALSPVSVAFARRQGLISPYVLPRLQQVFDFVTSYIEYYRTGAGASHPEAAKRAKNAERVRFNIETKVNPRARYADRTLEPASFADAVARVILGNGLADRADIQSFDFRTLLRVHEMYPQIRTVFLFTDAPVYADASLAGTDEGMNLQPEGMANTPWLGGLYWPYRSTAPDRPFRIPPSGGFESMALSKDGKRLYPLLERAIVGGDPSTRVIYEFDIASRRYTGVRHLYKMEQRGEAVADFVLFGETHGLVLERDSTQGKLDGFKGLYEVKLNGDGQRVSKRLAVDLLHIDDAFGLSATGSPGDVGLGAEFAFPFVTIESVLFFDSTHVGVINDNNFPFSVGRHVGTGAPDDTEFIRVRLDQELGRL